jgi:PAS domain S-box-containing protein
VRGQDEAGFDELLADLDAVVWEYETDAELYAYMSPSCERLFGYPHERWLTEPEFWESIVHPDDLERVEAHYRAVESQGGHHRVEYRFRTQDGCEVWVRDVVHVIDRGPRRPALVRGVTIDITEQRRAVDALADAEQRYRSLVERLPAVVYLWSLEHSTHGEPVYISPQLESLLGFTPAEWLADPGFWERRMHPDDVPWVVERSEEAEVAGCPYVFDYRVLERDGREVCLHDESLPVAWETDGRAIPW